MENISFVVGQEWAYATREFEKESTFIVTKIDKGKNDQIIVHIFVKSLKMKNSLSQTGFNDHIIHLPFDSNSLSKCTLELKSSQTKLPDFKDGYLEWLKMFESGKAGVFQTSLIEAIYFIEQHFN